MASFKKVALIVGITAGAILTLNTVRGGKTKSLLSEKFKNTSKGKSVSGNHIDVYYI